MDIHLQKKIYIAEAIKIALCQSDEQSETNHAVRVKFWQGLTAEDRMQATTEIVRRVHIARGGDPDDLKLKKNVVRVVRTSR